MNKVAVVTGGAKGIGAAVCRRLAADGFSVAVLYRTSQQEAEALAAELCAVTDAICVPVDVTDTASVTAAFEQVTRELGPVYALVNNAGVAAQELLTDVTDGAWNTMIETDLGSVFRCCRAALPHMLHSHDGRIVNIASMWGEIGGSMETPYSAAKAGVIGLTKALAKEVGPSGITVNAV
ncbi:MAG: SDR family NAD(P)-dependent oxidoreductase, partial [Clostridia bacterium]|nr:SDR family NAD(P)-dependent oxidoreductase [Clostridia bacterium]